MPYVAELKSSNHAAYRLHYHVVFTVKYRHACIDAAMLAWLRGVFADVCRSWRCELTACNGEADHVHLLIDGHPSMNLARLVGNLKTVSARYIRNEFAPQLARYFWKAKFWNSAYAVVSAGGHASIERLIDYVRDQDAPAAAKLAA